MSNTKITIIITVALAFLIIGCTATNTKSPSQSAAAASNKTASALTFQIKNPELKDEIFRLRQDMAQRNLTEADTARILQLSKDPVEAYYAKEFAWLVKYNEPEHLNHPLTFLDWYVRNGQESFCAPHELGHIAAYIRHNDMPYAEEQFAFVKQKMQLWEAQQEINRQKYPKFYEGLVELKGMMGQVMPLLEKKDYGNETVRLLDEIDQKTIC